VKLLRSGVFAILVLAVVCAGIVVWHSFKRVSVVVENHSGHSAKAIRVFVGTSATAIAELSELRTTETRSFASWVPAGGGWRIEYRSDDNQEIRAQNLDGAYVDTPGRPVVVVTIEDGGVSSRTELAHD
jgi:hypothetical protein